MKSDYLIGLKEVINAVARQEDLEIRRLAGKGIMDIPELTFTYQVAKAISIHYIDIFGVPYCKWKMNKGIGSGLTDLVIDTPDNEKNIAIEFKMSTTVDKYMDDLRKLAKLDRERYDRIFCAIMDVFYDDIASHGRIIYIDENQDVPVERVDDNFDFFSILSDYQKQTCCVIGLWKII